MSNATLTPLTVRVRFTARDRVQVRLGGELDLSTAPMVPPLGELLTSLDVVAVDLDLGGVDFVDLTGARALDELRRTLTDAGVVVIGIGASPAVVRLRALLGQLTETAGVGARAGRRRRPRRLGLVAAALAGVAAFGAAGCGDDDSAAPTTPPTSTTAVTAAPVTGMDFVGGGAVELGDGWTLEPCESGPAVYCARLDGETEATIEVMSVRTSPEDVVGEVLGAGGSTLDALRAYADEFQGIFEEDRAAGCGAGYAVTRFGPEETTVAGHDGIVYGFDGTDGGRHVERALQFATIDGDTLHLISTTAIDDGTCVDDGELAEFTVAELTALEPVITDVVAVSTLPR